jgi:hypothetical protein
LASESFESLGRKLRVFVAAPGRHLFTIVRDPRLRVYPWDFTGEPKPDLVVYPCSQHDQLERLDEAGAPPSVLERIRSGKARVVFDGSGEGHAFEPERAASLHATLERLGGSPQRAVYITQDRAWGRRYLEDCARRRASPMQVLIYDYWIRRFFGPLEEEGTALLELRLQAFADRPARRPRRFVSMNWSPRPSKIFFLLSLMRDGLWNKAFISFGGTEVLNAITKGGLPGLDKAMSRLAGFEDLHLELRPLLKALYRVGRLELGEQDKGSWGGAEWLTSDLSLDEYAQSWFSVITETEMRTTPSRITEKPFKALVNFHPILVFGNPGALRMIRELGFETFPELFDESYDDEPDPRRRFDMAYAEVVRLCRMEKRELYRAFLQVDEKLRHNAVHGLTRLPRIYTEEVDRELVDRMAGQVVKPPQLA